MQFSDGISIRIAVVFIYCFWQRLLGCCWNRRRCFVDSKSDQRVRKICLEVTPVLQGLGWTSWRWAFLGPRSWSWLQVKPCSFVFSFPPFILYVGGRISIRRYWLSPLTLERQRRAYVVSEELSWNLGGFCPILASSSMVRTRASYSIFLVHVSCQAVLWR